MTEHPTLPAAWRARWIWGAPAALRAEGTQEMLVRDDAPAFSCFRRVVDVGEVPDRARARVTADSRYVLWLNGVEVGRGPVRGNPQLLHYDTIDLSPHLRPGRNVLSALVRFYRVATPWWRPSVTTWGLGAGAFALEATIGSTVVGTDESWTAVTPAGWTGVTGDFTSALPVEKIDGRDVPASWHDVDFDDSWWVDATPLPVHYVGFTGSHSPPTYPYGALLPRPIGSLGGPVRSPDYLSVYSGAGGDALDDPVAQVEADDGAVSPARIDVGGADLPLDLGDRGRNVVVVHADFGRIVAGTVVLEVEAPAGTQIDAMAAERVDPDGTLRRDEQHAGFRYTTRGGVDRFETFDSLGLRHLGLSVRSTGPVVLRRLEVAERLAPRPDGASFECSDPLLDRVWHVGRRTVDLCSMDAYLDCPTREQRAWTGDAVVHQMVDLVTNPDWRLARSHVEMTAASQRPDGMLPMAVAGDAEAAAHTIIPDWALHWVRSVHNLWRYTGDRELVQSLLPVAERVLRWFLPYQRPDGLLHEVTGWVLIDWSAVSTAGSSSALTGLWARGLRDFAEMAEWVGDAGRATWARHVWSAVHDGFDAYWDPDRSRYVDHLVDGARRPESSQHANAAALVGGLVPDERTGAVVEVLTDRDRLVHASWLRPGRPADRPDDDAMYGDPAYLFVGPPEPWWDVATRVVAAQPFFRYVVHDSLAAAGRADLVVELCRDWEALLDRCDTSLSETWFGGTHCHGWSATPTRDLVVRTLGAEPASPGWVTARVAPRLGGLEWAEATVPTPHGPFHVRATVSEVAVDTPVPCEIDDGTTVRLVDPGSHDIPV